MYGGGPPMMYQGNPSMGGYPGNPPMGGYPGDPSMGGYPLNPSMGGYPGDPSMGGYPGDPSMGGYPGDPSMGGYPGDPSMGGYGGDPFMGGSRGGGGPMQYQEDDRPSHHCTDIPCCLLFLIGLGVLTGLYIYGLADGSLEKLYHGIDSEGRICGHSKEVDDKPLLYWCSNPGFPASGVDLSDPVCVEKCPSSTEDQVPECAEVDQPTSAYETEEFINRYCLPDESIYEDIYDEILEGPLDQWGNAAINAVSTSKTASSRFRSGIGNAWPAYIACFFLSIAVGIVYLCFVRMCSGPCIVISCLLGIATVIGLGIYVWVNAEEVQKNTGHDDALWQMRALAICLWVAGVLLFAMLLCLCGSVRHAAAAIEVAVDCMCELPCLFIVPIIYAFLKVAVFIVLLIGFLFIFSTADVKSTGDGVYREFDVDGGLWTILITYLILAVWVQCFLTALYQYTLAFLIVEYYYEPPGVYGYKDIDCFGCPTLIEGICNGLMFHTGSLALGSAIITIFEIIQKLIEYAQKINEQHGDNPLVRCILCCCLCCAECCQQCVSFINKNIYIQMAIDSSGFCRGLRKVMGVFASIGATVALLNGATYVMKIFGVILTASMSALLCYIIVTNGTFVDQSSSYFVDEPALATLVAAIIGGLVGISFMTIFDMVADTLLYCFGHDRKNGKNPQTAPVAFQELLRDYK